MSEILDHRIDNALEAMENRDIGRATYAIVMALGEIRDEIEALTEAINHLP